MNEDDSKTILYEVEKKNLIKKISIFLVISVAFTFIFTISMSDSSFFTCLMVGLLCGCAFYIPGRLQSYFHMRWFMTIIAGVVFLLIILFIADKIGPLAYIILLFPPVDIGYSIFKLVSLKKQNGGGEQP